MTDEELLLKYEPMIKKLSYRNRVYNYEVEDLQQEFRMLLLKCYNTFDHERGIKFITYFVKSCENLVSKLRAKEKEEHHHSLNNKINGLSGQEFLETVVSNYSTPITEAIASSLHKSVSDYLDTLPYGSYTKMYILYGMSQSEIAEIEGTDRFMVSRRHQNNLKLLKEKFVNGATLNIEIL